MILRLVLETVIFMVILIAILLLGVFIGNGTLDSYFTKNSFNEPDSQSCENLSLQDTSICLERELSVFFNYNLSNVEKDMTLKELKSEGGVCSHYSKWYCDRAEELGFNCKKVIISISSKGYCILDQTFTPKCYKLGGDGGRHQFTVIS